MPLLQALVLWSKTPETDRARVCFRSRGGFHHPCLEELGSACFSNRWWACAARSFYLQLNKKKCCRADYDEEGCLDERTAVVVCPRCVNSLDLVCSLSSHRHSYIGLIFSSRFIHSYWTTTQRSHSFWQHPVYGKRVNSLVLVFSLSSHRHSYIDLIFRSRFADS
jgi:hypothetical protein